ncbi:acetoacetate--CoA ligase [Pseudomonadales bacterium]|nr:acetoacetate--CoA ligase [Pseudomonadales bacterium]
MDTAKPLWRPSPDRMKNSQLQAFANKLEHNLGLKFPDYQQLHLWSVNNPGLFWEQVWEFMQIIYSSGHRQVLSDADKFPGAQWFEGAKLNFAENLLHRRDSKTAIVAMLENGSRRTMSYAELYIEVAKVAAALKNCGVTKGDRVAGVLPNVCETVIAMLASASLGAIWSSCSPDFGTQGILDRFGQIQPKVLFAADGYFYNGKTIDCSEKISEVCNAIDSIRQLVVVSVIGQENRPLPLKQNRVTTYADFLQQTSPTPELQFAQLPFDHPLYIVYSSGTTGAPKCIVHGAGGTLVQHLKEHRLHVDLTANDTFFYFTTCGWMMWNWMISGLASGATLVLFDGSPFYPSPTAMFDMIEQEKISIFGTSAKFISSVEKEHLIPQETHRLDSLKTILTTGSPLSHESFRYVYDSIKQNICLSSISGGTDIISCFVLGNSCLPVWEGEIQCIGLGMAVEFWDESGHPIVGQKGEMVCTHPFPSSPIGFWNDPGNVKYQNAYFERYPNVWVHSDYGEVTEHGGVIIHGRSDAVLNPGGVRIGTAEIYRQVEKIDAILESICIGQRWKDDVRVILFVVLREGIELTDALEKEIRRCIRQNTTARHVPAKIIAVPDVPRTLSGKIVELAVSKIVHDELPNNNDSLANPDALDFYRNIAELQF